jgi:hypothetical protein
MAPGTTHVAYALSLKSKLRGAETGTGLGASEELNGGAEIDPLALGFTQIEVPFLSLSQTRAIVADITYVRKQAFSLMGRLSIRRYWLQ